MMISRRSLLLRALTGLVALRYLDAAQSAEPEAVVKPRVIGIQARKFSYTPNEITVSKGEHIILELTALDFVHGFNIPALHIRSDIPPGKVTTVALQPTEAGRFTFLCDNFCGSGHEEMNGVLIVTP